MTNIIHTYIHIYIYLLIYCEDLGLGPLQQWEEVQSPTGPPPPCNQAGPLSEGLAAKRCMAHTI